MLEAGLEVRRPRDVDYRNIIDSRRDACLATLRSISAAADEKLRHQTRGGKLYTPIPTCLILNQAAALVRNNKTLQKLPGGAFRCADMNHDATQLLTGGDDKAVTLFELCSHDDDDYRQPKVIAKWKHQKKIAAVAFTASPHIGIFADRFGEVFSVQLNDDTVVPTLRFGHLSPISHMYMLACGSYVMSADREGHVRATCWPHSDVIERFFLAHVTPVQIVLSLDTEPESPGHVLTGSADGTQVCVFRFSDGKLLSQMTASELLHVWSDQVTAPKGDSGKETPPQDEASSAAMCSDAIECACFCGHADEMYSIAFGFRDTSHVLFALVADSPAAIGPNTAREPIVTDGFPLQLTCSREGVLCVLTSSRLAAFDLVSEERAAPLYSCDVTSLGGVAAVGHVGQQVEEE